MRRRLAWTCAALTALPLLLASGWLLQTPARATVVAAARTRILDVGVIYTAAPVYDSLAALRGGERFPQGAQLMALREGKAEPLVPRFAASADATLSFDAKTIVFAGKKTAAEPWAIWSVAADGGEPQPVIRAATDLIRPLPMPDGRFVYARRGPEGFTLETAGPGRSNVLQLSYGPGNFVPDDVLRDGRVLFESMFPLGVGATPEMYLVYADGSGVESVRCDHAAAVAETAGRAHGRQMRSGDIVFTHGQSMARFTSALAGEQRISQAAADYAGDLAELPDGRWVLAMRLPGEKHLSLRVARPGELAPFVLARDPARDLVEPVLLVPPAVPNRHPSGLHNWKTGNLLALDARLSRDGPLGGIPAAVRVETLGDHGQAVATGTAPVEKDGSFFVQARGDHPLRFVLLDAQGRTLRAERGWFWMRQGEQRICVGCHAGPERAPDNRVPQVLLRTTIPVDVRGGVLTAQGEHE